MSRLIVQKYGGSSLADAERIRHVAGRIARDRRDGAARVDRVAQVEQAGAVEACGVDRVEVRNHGMRLKFRRLEQRQLPLRRRGLAAAPPRLCPRRPRRSGCSRITVY